MMPLATSRPAFVTDEPVSKLDGAEWTLVSGMRIWAAWLHEGEIGSPSWRRSFAAHAVGPDGMSAFDTLMRLVVGMVRGRLDVRPPACPHLGRDEIRVIRLLHLLQHGRADEAGMILADWLPVAGMRQAMAPASALAAELLMAGLALPVRYSSVGAECFSAGCARAGWCRASSRPAGLRSLPGCRTNATAPVAAHDQDQHDGTARGSGQGPGTGYSIIRYRRPTP